MQRRGFTLIELLVVIVIIGVVYSLAVNGLKRYEKIPFDLNLMSLNAFMRSNHQNQPLSVICVDRCRECFVYDTTQKVQTVEPFIDESVKMYRFDYRYGMQQIDHAPFFDENGIEHDVCFRYDYDATQKSEKVFVEYDAQVTALEGYLGDTRRFKTLNDATEYQRLLATKVQE